MATLEGRDELARQHNRMRANGSTTAIAGKRMPVAAQSAEQHGFKALTVLRRLPAQVAADFLRA
ncbi:MAG: hypothetical protein JJ899_06045 [Alphaproteobacteria bacterium]|nr:hypothetical protein [Alphaproteobacteria bacterium]